jgi:DNA-directed RNA polymerase subunit M/transcription elongation factor TFIIS
VESIDQEHEWRQLKETYGQMTEDELFAVAEDAYDLTPIAKEVLRAEIAARGLPIQLKNAPAITAADINIDDLVCIYQLWDEHEAKRVKGILDAASIPSFLGPENLLHLEDFKSGFENGVDLKVSVTMQGHALATLEEAASEENEDEEDDDEEYPPGDGEGYEVLCPKCQSLDVVFEDLDQEGPANDEMFNWRCADCGHRWKDGGVGQKV